jgi:hypothetical protein
MFWFSYQSQLVAQSASSVLFVSALLTQWRNGGRRGALWLRAYLMLGPVDCCHCLTEILYLY